MKDNAYKSMEGQNMTRMKAECPATNNVSEDEQTMYPREREGIG